MRFGVFDQVEQPGDLSVGALLESRLQLAVRAPTDAEADELGRSAWKQYTHNLGLLFRRFDVPIPNDPTVGGDYERAKELNVIVVGSPERVRDHCEELSASPLVEYIIGAFAFGNMSHDHALRSIDLFAEHLITQG